MAISGRFELVSSDNFDAYLKAVGVGFAKRTLVATMKPTIEISESGGRYTIKTHSALKTTEISFTPGVEFDEETADGRSAKSVVTIEGSKLIHIQKIGDDVSKTIREFVGDEMKVTYTCKDAVATRVYRKSG